MNFFLILKLLLQLLPIITQAVQAVEAAVGPGNGQAKKDAVLAAVQAAQLAVPLPVADAQGQPAEAVKVGDVPGIASGIGHMIDSAVSLLNQAGIFKK